MEDMVKGQQQVLSPTQLFEHWQGHRNLTRKVMEAFPEKEFFEFSIGGMRPFADLTKELLAIAEPGLREMVTGKTEPLEEHRDFGNTKSKLLELWDESTEKLNALWPGMDKVDFQKEILSFGQFPGTVQSSLFYFIDNEIHHRGQGYVYLRALGITPPLFYER